MSIAEIEQLERQLHNKYSAKIAIDANLNRQLVSFQNSKSLPYYRWFKYKEGFSAQLVQYYLNKLQIKQLHNILDPFAGSGTTLFTAKEQGIDATGIELLPIGCEVIKARLTLQQLNTQDFSILQQYIVEQPWHQETLQTGFVEFSITKGAFPQETKRQIEQYLTFVARHSSKLKTVLQFALLCVLESISYTSKDGQYLRWDKRSGRTGCLHKAKIEDFPTAICHKLKELVEDSHTTENLLFPSNNYHDSNSLKQGQANKATVQLLAGSCLELLQGIRSQSYSLVFTSPPYANRYDYTRTYALELAMLGICPLQLVTLRQAMLSCTVENKAKDILAINPKWANVLAILDRQVLLGSIVAFLHDKKAKKQLNNNGIPRMIQNYFIELSCVIYELYRILQPNGYLIMVNDNVRYAGLNIPLDLILSQIAQDIGFKVQSIAVLPSAKGNSSQQMGMYGCSKLRKSIYIWQK